MSRIRACMICREVSDEYWYEGHVDARFTYADLSPMSSAGTRLPPMLLCTVASVAIT